MELKMVAWRSPQRWLLGSLNTFNPIGLEWMPLTLSYMAKILVMTSASCSHLTNLSRIMTSRALTFRKCDMILWHPLSAKYLLPLPTISHILKHFPCIFEWLHCSIVANSQVSTNKLELVCNCKWQESLTKFQFFAKIERRNKSIANWSQKTFKFQLGLELTSSESLPES